MRDPALYRKISRVAPQITGAAKVSPRYKYVLEGFPAPNYIIGIPNRDKYTGCLLGRIRNLGDGLLRTVNF